MKDPLGLDHKTIQAISKEIQAKPKEEGCTETPSLKFPGLVDLVTEDGEIKYLV